MRPLQRPLNFTESLNSYYSFFQRCLRASFAYKSTTINNLITASVSYAITIMIWRQVYQQNPDLSISRSQIFVYLLMAGCVNYAMNLGMEFRVGQRIRTGQIATDLLKPMDFQVAQGIQSISDGIFNGILGLAVFFCGFLVFGTQIFPPDFTTFLLFLVSFLLGFAVIYGIGFLFVQGAFFTYSGYGVFAARNAMQFTFSGVSAPLDFYPDYLKTITNWLPFRHTIYTPISIYMGWAKGDEVYSLLLQQLGWVIGLFLLGKWVMSKALKQLEVQGG
jgi:ABC-2 type transport system permease protein